MVQWVIGLILHGGLIKTHWCNKGRGMCYLVCGMVHIQDPLQLIKKRCPCSGGSGFPLSLSEWYVTMC